MSDLFSTAAAGIASATNRFEASAKRVAQDPRADLPSEIVQQKLASAEVEANVAVLKTADKMMKSLLDILV
jgi:flagellar basal body rod protein FlgC